MPHTRRLILFIPFLLAAAAGSSACSEASPAGPSPSASGATITGSLVAERALSGVTVAVSGTKLGATVGSSQSFTISDVPAGTVRLMFRGPALNGAIELTGVQPDDAIELVVRINGSVVVLDSEQRRRKGDDDDADVKFDGVLTSRTGTPPTLVLTVGGRTVRTNAWTAVRKDGQVATFDALVVGARLAVAGTREGDGSVLARRIDIQDDDRADVKFDGVLTARTGTPPTLVLTVGGRIVRTDASTAIRENGRLATFDALVVGARLEVAGTREADGSVLAERIDVDNTVKFDGVLTSRTGTPPTLVLTVAGRTVRTDASTIVRRNGALTTLNALVVGQRLEVEGTREEDGSILARRVEIQDRDDADPCGFGGASVNRDLDLVGDCTITGRVNGNIRISNGTLTVDGTVDGNIEQSGIGGVTVQLGASVNGNIKETGAGDVTVRGTVNGKIEEEDAGDVTISAAGHAKGDVIEKGLGDVEVNGRVDGNVEESEAGSVLGNGVVNGNVKESGIGIIATGLTVKGKRDENG